MHVKSATLCTFVATMLVLAACDRQVPSVTSAPTPEALAGLENCDTPVYLVVWIENLVREKSGAYGKALRQSKIVSRHGGTYLAVSPPTLLLEGDWPEDRGFVVEQYPCKAALEQMWYSQEYQKEIKPLRDGSGDYTVALFDAWPPS